MQRQKLFDRGLQAFLLLSPVFLFRDYRISMARGMFFIFATFALYAISLGVEPKRKLSSLLLGAFLLLAFVRMFFDNGLPAQATEWFNFWISAAKFIYVFCGVLLFQVVYTHAGDIKEYIKPVIAVCIANACVVLGQLSGNDFLWHNAPSICGFMENSSQLGQYSALALPLVALINPFLALIPLFTLIASKSVSPMLAAAAGMAFLSVLRGYSKAIVFIVGICLIISGFLGFGYIKSKWACRPVMWQKTAKVAFQKPFLGHGYCSFPEKVSGIKGNHVSLGGPEYARAHNDYLHLAQEAGFPILAVIGIFIFGLFRKFIRYKPKDKVVQFLAISCLIVFINMGGQTFCRYASTMSTFIVILALFCAKLEDYNAEA